MTDHISHTNKEKGSIAERVLGRIEHDHVVPRSRAAFAAENWLFWSIGGLAVALGALASAAALFELANAGWDFYAETHPGFFSFLLASAPFLWLLVLALFILIGYENIRRTKRGYRYPFAVIILGAVLTSIALGAALFAAGFGQEIEESVGDHPPFYRPLMLAQHAWWMQPARGLLGGEVLSVDSARDTFILKDFNGNLWTVDAGDLSTSSEEVVETGGVVRIEGIPDALATSTLRACAVFAWETYGRATALPLHAPLGFLPPPDERSPASARIQSCKGTRPYGPPSGAPIGE